jgi:hypothetical protein
MRTRRTALGAAFLTLTLLMTVIAPVSAAAPAPGSDAASSGRLTQHEWTQLKAELEASSLPRTVTVSGGTRTYTYTLPSGSALVLSEPSKKADLAPMLGVGGCGWFNVCIYLNRVDQGALATGGAILLTAAICAIPAVGWLSCAAIAAAIAVGAYYIAAYGFCPRYLQIGLIPPGSNVRCV